MSNKIYHWTSTFKTLGETEDGGVNIKGSASTNALDRACLLYTSPSPRDGLLSRMPSSA